MGSEMCIRDRTGETRSDGWLWNLLFDPNQEKQPSMLDRIRKQDERNSATRK